MYFYHITLIGMEHILGIDIGGSGIKGAIVDKRNGQLLSDRLRIPTPSESTPANILEIVSYIIEQLEYSGTVGVGMPGPVIDGKIAQTHNLHEQWHDFNAQQFFTSALEVKVKMINDADAAAKAEYMFGDWPVGDETVIFLTIGTGIGSSIWVGSHCLKNSELGQLRLRKKLKFEDYASDRARKEEELSWTKWGARLNKILKLYDQYFSKPHFIIGGGIANKKDRFEKYISEDIKWHSAKLENEAGIIGAAIFASED